MLQSQPLFCVTGAVQQTLFHPRARVAGVSQNEMFWRSFFVAGAVLVTLDGVLKGSRISFCHAVVEFDLGHADDSVWQLQHFGCLGLIFRARRRTL